MPSIEYKVSLASAGVISTGVEVSCTPLDSSPEMPKIIVLVSMSVIVVTSLLSTEDVNTWLLVSVVLMASPTEIKALIPCDVVSVPKDDSDTEIPAVINCERSSCATSMSYLDAPKVGYSLTDSVVYIVSVISTYEVIVCAEASKSVWYSTATPWAVSTW